ncbi:MAG: squalene/phytoene synthase family protein [bacterium]
MKNRSPGPGAPPDLAAILKKVSRSLYLSLRILPSGLREAMSVAYLFCRAADSIADTRLVPREKRLFWIENFSGLLNSADDRSLFLSGLTGEITGSAGAESERQILLSIGACMAVYDRLPDEEKQLIFDVLKGVCEGMKTDLLYFPAEDSGLIRAFDSANRLENYCSSIGGEPGRFWSRLYLLNAQRSGYNSDSPSEEDGKSIGEALQMTNILKDIAADLRIGRCYLPADELAAAGLTPERLMEQSALEPLRPVLSRWMRWAVQRLDTSEPFVSCIPMTSPRLRAAVIWPIYWAMDTLALAAESSSLLDPSRKTKISRNRIYSTILGTPDTLVSNTAFRKGYRLRRESFFAFLS